MNRNWSSKWRPQTKLIMIVKGLILRSVPLFKLTLLSSCRFCSMTAFDEGSTDKSQLVYHYGTQIYESRKAGLVSDGRCNDCFLPLQMCLCKEVGQLFRAAPFKPKAKLHVYMHYKEWGRASNTGKLMAKGMPDDCKIHVFGVKEHCSALIDELRSKPSLILYPSSSATSIANYTDLYASSDGNLNLCVIDSTWSQAATMEKSLPADIPRVKVDDFVLKASEFLNRKQTQEGRVSTIEAVILALQALGEAPENLLAMQQSLRLSVDVVSRLRGRGEHYGNSFVSNMLNFTSIDGHDPYTKPKITRPESCPHCYASNSTTIFKNIGLRKGHWVKGNDDAPDEDRGMVTFPEEKTAVGVKQKERHRAWKCQACKKFFFINES